jgi:hypothetical protein
VTGRSVLVVATGPEGAGDSTGHREVDGDGGGGERQPDETVVLDATWTAGPETPSDVRAARTLVAGVLRDHDPLRRSMVLLDRWADASAAAARFDVDGHSYWPTRRLHLWRDLHDRLIWRWVLGALEGDAPIDRLDVHVDHPALVDVAGLVAAQREFRFDPPASPDGRASPSEPPPARVRLPWPVDPLLWRLGLHPNQRTAARRAAAGRGGSRAASIGAGARPADRTDWAAVGARVGELARRPGRPLVLTAPSTHQSVARDGATSVADPFLGPVVDELRARGIEPTILELGVAARPADLRARPTILPATILARLFDDPADGLAAAASSRAVAERLAASLPPLDADGLDLGPWLAAALRDSAGEPLTAEVRSAARIGRFLAALRPSVLVTINEYSRPEWLAEAHRLEIPVVAVQHGVIHPRHAGYILPDRAGTPIADRTYVFGPYEARLLTGSSVYRSDEVVVAGAPRLDLIAAEPPAADERARLRTELGVAADDRLVVFSSTSNAAARSTIIAAAFDALLDGPWPAVHLVVKLHPAEPDDEPFYRDLVAGLAAARRFEPPPVTIVKSVDLFELLRAADAHLGVSSTVLTDAVAAGTPNLIVAGFEGTDMIGYVDAGVAVPVRSAADVVTALADVAAIRPSPAARDAFLADHFAPGKSAATIADGIAALGRQPAGQRPALR